jgi:hypothetical protein
MPHPTVAEDGDDAMAWAEGEGCAERSHAYISRIVSITITAPKGNMITATRTLHNHDKQVKEQTHN